MLLLVYEPMCPAGSSLDHADVFRTLVTSAFWMNFFCCLFICFCCMVIFVNLENGREIFAQIWQDRILHRDHTHTKYTGTLDKMAAVCLSHTLPWLWWTTLFTALQSLRTTSVWLWLTIISCLLCPIITNCLLWPTTITCLLDYPHYFGRTNSDRFPTTSTPLKAHISLFIADKIPIACRTQKINIQNTHLCSPTTCPVLFLQRSEYFWIPVFPGVSYLNYTEAGWRQSHIPQQK